MLRKAVETAGEAKQGDKAVFFHNGQFLHVNGLIFPVESTIWLQNYKNSVVLFRFFLLLPFNSEKI